MASGQAPSISSDSGDDKTPEAPSPFEGQSASRECRILYKMKNKLKRYPQHWAGDPFDSRDNALLFGISADLIDVSRYMGTCHLARIAFFRPGDDIMRQTDIQWRSEQDNVCKMIVSRCGGKLHGFLGIPNIIYPRELKEYHTKVEVKIILPTIAMTRYGVSWGMLSTHPDKIQIFSGPDIFTPRHQWDCMILHDCAVTREGNLWRSREIATRKWDILLMKMGMEYNFPWLPISIRDATPFQDPRGEQYRECYPCASPNLKPQRRGVMNRIIG